MNVTYASGNENQRIMFAFSAVTNMMHATLHTMSGFEKLLKLVDNSLGQF
jgi:hypothetical protein